MQSLKFPHCLTCPNVNMGHSATTTSIPPKIVTTFEESWEAEPTLPPLPTTTTKKKLRKGIKKKVRKKNLREFRLTLNF